MEPIRVAAPVAVTRINPWPWVTSAFLALRLCLGRDFQHVVVPQGQVLQDGGHRAPGLLGRAGSGLADHALGGGGDLDGEVAFALRPAARPPERVDRLVKVALGQVGLALGVHGMVHVDHLGVQQQAEGGLGLVGMDEVGAHLPAALGRAEELAHAPVPVDHPEDARQLVALHELLDGRLEHPQVAVVVDDQLFAEAVVP